MHTHAKNCTKTIIPVLRNLLTVEQLDMLLASVLYDTSNFEGELSGVIGEDTPHGDLCEKESNE